MNMIKVWSFIRHQLFETVLPLVFFHQADKDLLSDGNISLKERYWFPG